MRDYRILGPVVIAAACIKSIDRDLCHHDHRADAGVRHVARRLAAVRLRHRLLIVKFAEQPSSRSSLSRLVACLPILGRNGRRTIGASSGSRFCWPSRLLGTCSRKSKFKDLRGALLSGPAADVAVTSPLVGTRSRRSLRRSRRCARSATARSTPRRCTAIWRTTTCCRRCGCNIVPGSGLRTSLRRGVKLPDISFFVEYRYMPHNSLLGSVGVLRPLWLPG